MSQATPEWLDEHLSQLLSSPYIHFTQPKVPGLQLRMGPGPIDLFSTRFANMFATDATGVLNGSEVDKAGLKEAMLKMQKTFNKDTVTFAPQQLDDDSSNIATTMTWTRKDTEGEAQMRFIATMQEGDDAQRIQWLQIDGTPDLFQ